MCSMRISKYYTVSSRQDIPQGGTQGGGNEMCVCVCVCLLLIKKLCTVTRSPSFFTLSNGKIMLEFQTASKYVHFDPNRSIS